MEDQSGHDTRYHGLRAARGMRCGVARGVLAVAVLGGFTSLQPLSAPSAVDAPEPRSEPAWSSDGEWVAFRGGDYPHSEIWIAASDGSNPVQVTRNDSPDHYPSWSPDASHLAFTSNRGGSWKLYVMARDGTESRALITTSSRADDPSRPAWSPDGEWIAVRVTSQDDEGDIFLVRPDGGATVRLTDAPGRDDDPGWSPDGRRIAFSSARDGNREIYVMARDGTGPTRITRHQDRDVTPSWFPDGRRLAFLSNRYGRMNWEILTIGTDGTGEVRLTDNVHWDFYPTASPDGTRILFASIRDGGMTGPVGLWVMNADGSGQRPFFAISPGP